MASVTDESDSASKIDAPRAGFRLAAHEVVVGVLVVGFAALALWFSELGACVAPLVLIGGALVLVGVRRRRKLTIAGGVLLVLSPVVAYGASMALLLVIFNWQAPIPQTQWPSALSLVASDTAAAARDVEAVSMGGFLDTENVWRLPMDQPKLEQAVRDLEVHEVPDAQVPDDFWDSFPRRMRPPNSPSNRYFMSEDFPVDGRGGDGLHHLAMYDPIGHKLHVLEINNF